MTCSNCGMEVPLSGNVCPYCKADKSGDQMIQALGIMGAFCGGILGALVGVTAGNPLAWVVAGLILGMIAGTLVALYAASKAKARKAAREKAAQEEPNRQRIPLAASSGGPIERTEADIAALSQNQERALIASGAYRECPHCAEVIKSAAKVCRFCQRDVEPQR